MGIRVRKYYSFGNRIFYVVLFILLGTFMFINCIGSKVSNSLVSYSKVVVRNIITESVNEAISLDSVNKYNINDLIVVSYSGDDIVGIDYNMENSYAFLSDIKSNLVSIINNKYDVNNNRVLIVVPFYNYTNNIFLVNLGPRVKVNIDVFKVVDSSISTSVRYYGINTIKLDMYVNFNITSNIVVPFGYDDIINSYSVVISSKVVNGKIPTYYGSGFRSESDSLNLQ